MINWICGIGIEMADWWMPDNELVENWGWWFVGLISGMEREIKLQQQIKTNQPQFKYVTMPVSLIVAACFVWLAGWFHCGIDSIWID